MTLRRLQRHKLPVVAFFELLSDPLKDDWPVCDSGALCKEPSWIQTTLEILSALQIDGEWLLGLNEDEQGVVAELVSAREACEGVNELALTHMYELIGGGAKGHCFWGHSRFLHRRRMQLQIRKKMLSFRTQHRHAFHTPLQFRGGPR